MLHQRDDLLRIGDSRERQFLNAFLLESYEHQREVRVLPEATGLLEL